MLHYRHYRHHHRHQRAVALTTIILLAALAGGCQPATPTPADTPIPPTPTIHVVTLPPQPTVPPTWTLLPMTHTPVPTVTATPTLTPTVPTAGPPPTEDPVCETWRGQPVANQEAFEGGQQPVIAWPILEAATAYIIDIYDPGGIRIVNEFVGQPAPAGEAAAETTPAGEAPTPGVPSVRYAVDVEKLGSGGYGFGWEVTPVNDAGLMCAGGLSGEFSYTPQP